MKDGGVTGPSPATTGLLGHLNSRTRFSGTRKGKLVGRTQTGFLPSLTKGVPMREEDERRRETPIVDLIALGVLDIIQHIHRLEREVMATKEELQSAVDQLQASVAALVVAEANETPGLAPGEVAVPQATLDSLNDQVVAAQASVDQVTAADTPAPAPEPAPAPAGQPSEVPPGV